jgi:hypothetical protein
MKSLSALFCTAIVLLAGCGLFSDDDPDDLADRFFPLQVGLEWTYEITESSLDSSKFVDRMPYRFTVSIVGKRTIEQEEYFLLCNHFVPGPYLPDTVFVRNDGSRVFIRIHEEDDELLFFSFAPPDTSWSIPMYSSPEVYWNRYAKLREWSAHSARIHWHANWENSWEEQFESGVGRVEIRSTSQVFGLLVWTLERSG